MSLFSWLFGPRPSERPVERDKDVVISEQETRPSEPRPHHKGPIKLAGDGEYDFEVVGESFRQDALSAICGGKCEDGHTKFCTALLVPEPNNKYDKNAVRVDIDGQHVAYLGREDAAAYRAAIKGLGLSGVDVSCDAVIRGGWSRPQRARARGSRVTNEGDFGVKLDLIWPLKIEQ